MQHEEHEQIAIMSWARLMEHQIPELRLLHHIPNGGKRSTREAQYLKYAGVKPGVPDLCLPVARGGYHGLYIELKWGKNTPTQDQQEMLAALNEQGYLAVVKWGADEAIQTLTDYLNGELKHGEN